MKFVWAAVAATAILFAGAASAQDPAQARRAEARAMFERIVGFQTVNGKGQTVAMAEYLSSQLFAAGFQPGDIELFRVGPEAGMTVRYPGRKGSKKPPVVFMAHMDVVGADPAGWTTDPWVLTEKDGSLYGRGVVDNKYGVLTLVQTFIRLKREGFVPDRELILAFSGDEETLMKTTQAIADRLKGAAFALNTDAGGAVIEANGKGTYAVQVAEKTYATFELTIRNKGGHSSAPRPDNAIYELADVLKKVSAYRFPTRWNAVTLNGFAAVAPTLDPALGKAMTDFARNPEDKSALAVMEATPWVDRELRTTCVATMLRAGTAENALPTAATATVNCRIFPGDTVADTQARLAQAAGNPALEFKVLDEPVESPFSEVPPEAMAALKAALGPVGTFTITPYMESGATDGAHFRRAGIPTIGVGPYFGSADLDSNVHGDNERMPLSMFETGLDFNYNLIKALTGGKRGG